MTDADHPRREVPLGELRPGESYLLMLYGICFTVRYMGSDLCLHPRTLPGAAFHLAAAHTFAGYPCDLTLLAIDGHLEDLDGNQVRVLRYEEEQ